MLARRPAPHLGALAACALVALVGTLAAGPRPASACGGLFCGSAQPVTQTGESIFFTRDGDTTHMLVRLTYQGPPVDFGWLLPVPPDVTSRIASAELFARLDSMFTPRFTLWRRFQDGCGPADDRFGGGGGGGGSGGAGGDGGDGGGAAPPPVQVVSREVVGPYDQVVLRADDAAELIGWLTEHRFQAPANAAALLQPYLDTGAAVLALRLTADATEDDVVPIHLTFTGDTPAIPLRPTAVAAEPDLGIRVHLFGPARAVPLNYLHVTINDAAIDWLSWGSNYVDVVSQAVDEAGGRAFVTDFSGLLNATFLEQYIPEDERLAAAAAVETLGGLFQVGQELLRDADIGRIAGSHFTPPPGVSGAAYLACLRCFDDDWSARAFDGAAFVDEVERDVLESRRLLRAPLSSNYFMTRLFTTMSPEEMTDDPIFGFNPDLEPVQVARSARMELGCTPEGSADFANGTIVTESGQEIFVREGQYVRPPIARQDGATVRGGDTLAARTIERMFVSGQPELLVDHRWGPAGDGSDDRHGGEGGGADDAATEDGEGCGTCAAAEGTRPNPTVAVLVALLAFTRRRRGGVWRP